jgi:hypothetical protein
MGLHRYYVYVPAYESVSQPPELHGLTNILLSTFLFIPETVSCSTLRRKCFTAAPGRLPIIHQYYDNFESCRIIFLDFKF